MALGALHRGPFTACYKMSRSQTRDWKNERVALDRRGSDGEYDVSYNKSHRIERPGPSYYGPNFSNVEYKRSASLAYGDIRQPRMPDITQREKGDPRNADDECQTDERRASKSNRSRLQRIYKCRAEYSMISIMLGPIQLEHCSTKGKAPASAQ
jgi:hypothetical protein